MKVVFFDIGDTLVSERQWLPGARETLNELNRAGVRLGLISNTGNLDRESIEALLPDDFDFELFEHGLVLLSSEVSMEKPSLGIFLYAVQHAGVSPWDTCFVGESLEETLAAQNAGMHAARITEPQSDFAELVRFITG